MSKSVRYVACALFSAVVLCVPPISHAQAAFNGTWRVDLAQSKLSPKPIVFYTANGWYHCVDCATPFTVQADGADHAVTGEPFDSMRVTIVNPQTISIQSSKDGKVMGEQTRTVSADGKTLVVKGTDQPANSEKPVTFEATAVRDGVAPSGVHATSGKWILKKVTNSANGLLTTYKVDGDQVTMTDPTGDAYTAKLDGQDYPYKGSYRVDTVSLKLINPRTIEETDKRGGKVMEVDKMAISANGKTMTITATDPNNGRVSSYVAHKI
jgi:hypothetical protein